MKKTKKERLKKISTNLGKNIHILMPLIEEITEHELIPMCIIGTKLKKDVGGIDLRFCTLSDSHDILIYRFCESYVNQYKGVYFKDETT